MCENTDDLEQTLVLAAAEAANSYNIGVSSVDVASANSFPMDELGDYKLKPNENSTQGIKPSQSKSKLVEEESSDIIRSKSRREHVSEGYSEVVATHYNLIENKGLDERSKSRILYLRNFHNWIKSMLINEYLTKIKDAKKHHNSPIRVLDMCCGKGGDLQKWKKGGITHLICSDIADVSLKHCKERYNDMKSRSMRERGGDKLFSIEYIPADCTRVRLREKYTDPSMKLDLVSCQFGFHYSFESLKQAECMMRNASECLQPGGYFIGTIPDANDLIARAKKSKSNMFGNGVYKVILDFDINKPPLFGAKYNFHLDSVVNCPEFLIYFPVLVKLAKKYGLKLVKKARFNEFYETMKIEGRQLLSNMRCLEAYPPQDGISPNGTADDDYTHAQEFVEKEGKSNLRLGTLSKSEWEKSSLCMVFAFEKVKNTWNADGTPCYDI